LVLPVSETHGFQPPTDRTLCPLCFDFDDLKKAIAIQPIDHFQKIVPKKKFDGKHFTARETRLLEQVAFVFKQADADQMKEASHLKNEP